MSNRVPQEINSKTSKKLDALLQEIKVFEIELSEAGHAHAAQKLTEYRSRMEDTLLDKLQAIAYLKRERDNLKMELGRE